MNDSSCRSSQFDSITVPAMTDHEKELYKMSLGRHFYVSGTPFVKVESPDFVDSQQRLRADVPKVTRHDLAGVLLDNCFDDIQNAVAADRADATHCSYTSDGSTNVRGD